MHLYLLAFQALNLLKLRESLLNSQFPYRHSALHPRKDHAASLIVRKLLIQEALIAQRPTESTSGPPPSHTQIVWKKIKIKNILSKPK